MGNPIAVSKDLSKTAYDHLWMHFTRMSSYENAPVPTIVRGEGTYIYDDKGKRYLDGLAGLFVVQAGHGRHELAETAYKQAPGAGLLPDLVLRPPEGRRTGRAPRALRAGRPEQGLLHHRWRRGRRDRLEARQAVLQAHGQADQVQGHLARGRLPRHPAGRPVHHRPARPEGALRAAGPRRAQGRRTPTSTARRSTATTPRPSAAGPPTRSSRRSSSRARRPSPPSSWSRCRTPAAASRRRPATSSGCARSATSTTCCSSPTRSSAPSAASARCSPATSSTTYRT